MESERNLSGFRKQSDGVSFSEVNGLATFSDRHSKRRNPEGLTDTVDEIEAVDDTVGYSSVGT